MTDYIKIHPSDHVSVALTALPAGTSIETDGANILLLEDIPQGAWIHTHNMKTGTLRDTEEVTVKLVSAMKSGLFLL